MMLLRDILYKTAIEAVKGPTDITIGKIEFDSRKVEAGDVFVAIKGTLSDGHEFIDTAISTGAKAIVCESLPENILEGVTYVEVLNAHSASCLYGSQLLWKSFA